MIGVGDHIEIWNAERWAEHSAELSRAGRGLAEELARRPRAERMATLTYMATEHLPVLAPELIALPDPGPGDVVVDCTFGGGGHARLAAERIGPTGTLIGIDRDPVAAAAVRRARAGVAQRQTRFERGNYADALERARGRGSAPRRRLMDLGISSLQLDAAERGFSYSYDAPLDMRMDPDRASARRGGQRVAGGAPRGDDPRVRRGAPRARDRGEISRRRPHRDHGELVEAIRAAVPPAYRFGRGHPAKRTFQAIRITVNGELESLDRGSPTAWAMLGDGGPPRGDLLPLARGSAREALLRGARSRLRVPARAAGLRVRTRARGRAPRAPRGEALGGRDGAKSALAIGTATRGSQAGGRRNPAGRGRKGAVVRGMATTATATSTAPARSAPAPAPLPGSARARRPPRRSAAADRRRSPASSP